MLNRIMAIRGRHRWTHPVKPRALALVELDGTTNNTAVPGHTLKITIDRSQISPLGVRVDLALREGGVYGQNLTCG